MIFSSTTSNPSDFFVYTECCTLKTERSAIFLLLSYDQSSCLLGCFWTYWTSINSRRGEYDFFTCLSFFIKQFMFMPIILPVPSKLYLFSLLQFICYSTFLPRYLLTFPAPNLRIFYAYLFATLEVTLSQYSSLWVLFFTSRPALSQRPSSQTHRSIFSVYIHF